MHEISQNISLANTEAYYVHVKRKTIQKHLCVSNNMPYTRSFTYVSPRIWKCVCTISNSL